MGTSQDELRQMIKEEIDGLLTEDEKHYSPEENIPHHLMKVQKLIDSMDKTMDLLGEWNPARRTTSSPAEVAEDLWEDVMQADFHLRQIRKSIKELKTRKE